MKKNSLYLIVIVVVAVIILAGLSFLFWGNYLERETPAIKFSENISVIGSQKKFDIVFSDQKSGLSQVYAEIIQNNKGQVLADENISLRGNKQKIVPLNVDTTILKLQDGPAVIKLIAVDHSLFKNQTILSQPVTISTIPPQIFPLNPINHANQGGVCCVTFRTSKPCILTGIFVNGYFTPAYTVTIDNKQTFVVYFAIPVDSANNRTVIRAFARDAAGSEVRTSIPCLIKEKKFRADKMNVSDAFLQRLMPEFQAAVPTLRGKTFLDTFIYVNSQMREDNFKTIQKICQKSSPQKLWEGTFLRMANAQPMALFGDQRTYIYNGKDIGNSVHGGVDLASTMHAPIAASNNGIVVFSSALGIYGNTVIIDHGQGLFSLYGHLSSVNTAVGKTVKKGDIVGYSGMSGLAGGDHLHFGVMVGGQFVNPQEWWDPHWIEDNVNKKMIF